MSRVRVVLPVALVTASFAALLAGGYAFVGTGTGANATRGDVLGPGAVTVNMTIRHTRFAPDRLRVASGTTVRFVVRNDDPIGHELIVGDDGVHARHETGTEPTHAPRPGEMSIPPGATMETTFQFTGTTGAGSVLFACHLPRHLRYGMSGTVEVVAA